MLSVVQVVLQIRHKAYGVAGNRPLHPSFCGDITKSLYDYIRFNSMKDPMAAQDLDWKTLDEVSQVLKAAADSTRLRLMRLCLESDLTVTELTKILGHSQPRVSRHLKVLVDTGLLERHPEGAWVFYRLPDVGSASILARSLVARLPASDPLLAQDLDKLADIKARRREVATAYFSSVAEHWDDLRQGHGAEQAVEDIITGLVKLKAADVLIDVGTGTGRLLIATAEHIERGIGFDLSHEMLQVARSNIDSAQIRNCSVRHGDMYRLPLEPRAADAVIIHQVLHFADDPKAVIADAGRVLRKNGLMVVADFAPHEKEHWRDEHQHRRLGFSDDDVSQWFAEQGLSEVQAQKIEGSDVTTVVWSAHKS